MHFHSCRSNQDEHSSDFMNTNRTTSRYRRSLDTTERLKHRRTSERTSERTNERKKERRTNVTERTNECIQGKRTNERHRTNERMHTNDAYKRTNERTSERTNKRTNERTNEQTNINEQTPTYNDSSSETDTPSIVRSFTHPALTPTAALSH